MREGLSSIKMGILQIFVRSLPLEYVYWANLG